MYYKSTSNHAFMNPSPTGPSPETDFSEEFLTPEQRQAIVADILSDIALRIIKNRSDQAS